MTKEELITLLTEYKENNAKLKLRKKEKSYYERMLKIKPNIETKITGTLGINADIQSKNNISDKVGNAVVNTIENDRKRKEEAEEKIKELESEIEQLQSKVEEAEIRLNSLHYKEREILTAYYIEKRTADDISQNLYFELFSRTTSPRYIRKIVNINTEKLLKL